jgi:hypothetical protein
MKQAGSLHYPEGVTAAKRLPRVAGEAKLGYMIASNRVDEISFPERSFASR